MAGIFSKARLLLPRHPVGITSLAVRFLIRQENMSSIFCALLSLVQGPLAFLRCRRCVGLGRPNFLKHKLHICSFPHFLTVFQADVYMISVIAVRKRRWTSYQLVVEW